MGLFGNGLSEMEIALEVNNDRVNSERGEQMRHIGLVTAVHHYSSESRIDFILHL